MSWFFPIIIGVEGFNKEERDLVKKDVVVSWYCSWNGGNCIVLSAAILQRRIALEQIGEGVPGWSSLHSHVSFVFFHNLKPRD